MDPSHKENAGLQVPSLQPEQLTSASNTGLPERSAVEQASPGTERALVPAAAPPPLAAAPTIPLPVPASTPTLPSNVPATAAGSALPADDGDLIEKEWVTKAKQIVERTRDDPHKQSEDLTLFKADYMKKRYGKTIKVSR